ncbi:MAG: hypothetical protein O3B95_10475 [Chloroflexi bacterium]|nr:hypothetical protein [Chloroflexota bacterium]
MPELLKEEIDSANSEVLLWLGGDATVDPVNQFSVLIQGDGARGAQRLDQLRSEVRTFSPVWLPWGAVGLMVVGVMGLAQQIGAQRDGMFAVGILFAATGATLWITSTIAGDSLLQALAGQPFEPALHDRPEGWGLPVSVRVLVGDIRSEIFSSLASTMTRSGLLWVMVGVGLIAFSWLVSVIAASVKGRHHWLLTRKSVRAATFLALGIAVVPLLMLDYPTRGGNITCNGHLELCEKRYDEVTFPATHNAMSTSANRWFFPAHDVSIRQQLDDGVRALLIDTHYWQTVASEIEQLKANRTLRPEVIALMENIITDFGAPPGGTFLCHVTCWLGATHLTEALGEVREFLHENPNELITLIIQDAISSEDTQAAFVEAGLVPYLFEFEEGEQWPTLEEMIDSDRRLVVFAEQSKPPPGWYLHAWDYIQDTPVNLRSVSELTCDANRGSTRNSLLLLNHWIDHTPPDRVHAAKMNSSQVIFERAQMCADVRGMKPNFIAVNFHRQGDLFGAVDRLNRIKR